MHRKLAVHSDMNNLKIAHKAKVACKPNSPDDPAMELARVLVEKWTRRDKAKAEKKYLEYLKSKKPL